MNRPAPALQLAVRALLEQPLLLAGSDGFKEAIAWRLELQRFFARMAAWPVLAGANALRLVAAPAFFEGGRALEGLRSASGPAMLAWMLWYHEYLGLRLGESRQFSLSELASQIETHSGLTMTNLEHRRAVVQAVRTLETLGAMRVLDDNTQDWEGKDSGEAGGALLEFTLGTAYLMSWPQQVLPPTPLQRAVRGLLTGPALHRALDPEAFAALEQDLEHEAGLLTELEGLLGWSLELHGDYALLLRGGVTRGLAQRFAPGRSVIQAAGLLLLNALRDEVAASVISVDSSGRLLVTRNQLYASLDAVRAAHRDKWGQQGAASTEKLLREILADWREWGAATEIGEFWQLEALLSRFHAYYHDPDQPPLERAAGRRRRKA